MSCDRKLRHIYECLSPATGLPLPAITHTYVPYGSFPCLSQDDIETVVSSLDFDVEFEEDGVKALNPENTRYLRRALQSRRYEKTWREAIHHHFKDYLSLAPWWRVKEFDDAFILSSADTSYEIGFSTAPYHLYLCEKDGRKKRMWQSNSVVELYTLAATYIWHNTDLIPPFLIVNKRKYEIPYPVKDGDIHFLDGQILVNDSLPLLLSTEGGLRYIDSLMDGWKQVVVTNFKNEIEKL